MYHLTRMCCLCLNYSNNISHSIFNTAGDNKTYYEKLTTSLPNLVFTKDYGDFMLCTTCCENIDSVYEFNQRCAKNLDVFLGYKEKLNSLTNESRALTVRVADIREKGFSCEDCLDAQQRLKQQTDNIVQGNDTAINPSHKRMPGVIRVILEPDDSDEKCIQNCAYLESHNSVHVKTELQVDDEEQEMNMPTIDDVLGEEQGNTDIKMEPQVDDDDQEMNMPTVDDVLGTELDDADIKIEEHDVKIECFGSEVDDVLISRGTLNDEDVAHDQLETNSSSGHTDQPCTDINNTTGEKTTSRYQLRHSRGAHSSDVINEEPANDGSSLNVSSAANHSRARTDTSSGGVGDLSIHSTSEDEASEESSSPITHSLPHPSYVCDVCDMTFKNSRNLVSHKVTCQKPHVCSICKKRFSKSFSLTTHKCIHTGQKPCVCEVCKKKFSQASNLAIHKLIHTGQKPHGCDTCKKKFNQASNLATHKLIHTGQKPHVCVICKKKFSHASTLAKHKLIHTGQKPHVCDVCKNKFSQAGHLATHKLIHTGEKPHVCDVCKKKFSRAAHLATHKLIHTGQKPHGCDICKNKYRHAGTLAKHKLIHTGQKPYVCGICKKEYRYSSTLTKHKLVHTGQKPHV